MSHQFTSESVFPGHPDKAADQVSDAVLDLLLSNDRNARVAAECMLTDTAIIVAGETRSNWVPTDEELVGAVYDTLASAGYAEGSQWDPMKKDIILDLHAQSVDIAQGVDVDGAGDQGIMFGYACSETPDLMPLPIAIAHDFGALVWSKIQTGYLEELGPDGKTQATIRYQDGKAVGIDTLLISIQHHESVRSDDLRILMKMEAQEISNKYRLPIKRLLVNPTGRFTIGGPVGDVGLTGRKIIVDTYGGYAPHGGGAFSGKDPTKVDRSAAYIARKMAREIVEHSPAQWATIQLSYAIGVPEPTSINVTSDMGYKADRRFEEVLMMTKWTPKTIIRALDLQSPRYSQFNCFGHFGQAGKTEVAPWEQETALTKIKDFSYV